MSTEFLHRIHGWLFGLVFLALLLAASEAGFRLGRRSDARNYAETKSRIAGVEAAILGVLGLLLGFSMMMSVSRFDIRRQLVLEEANAIGTSYWRAQLVPAPEGPELANFLRDYVDAKLRYLDARADPDHLQAARARTARLQRELWSRAEVFAQKDPRSVTAGLLLQSLNQTFDLDSARWTALVIHVPDTVILVNSLVGLLAVLLVGYTFGLDGRRDLFSMSLLAVCIALVLAVIMDLDQPRLGLIQVGQQPMLDLQRQLGPPTR